MLGSRDRSGLQLPRRARSGTTKNTQWWNGACRIDPEDVEGHINLLPLLRVIATGMIRSRLSGEGRCASETFGPSIRPFTISNGAAFEAGSTLRISRRIVVATWNKFHPCRETADNCNGEACRLPLYVPFGQKRPPFHLRMVRERENLERSAEPAVLSRSDRPAEPHIAADGLADPGSPTSTSLGLARPVEGRFRNLGFEFDLTVAVQAGTEAARRAVLLRPRRATRCEIVTRPVGGGLPCSVSPAFQLTRPLRSAHLVQLWPMLKFSSSGGGLRGGDLAWSHAPEVWPTGESCR